MTNPFTLHTIIFSPIGVFITSILGLLVSLNLTRLAKSGDGILTNIE